MGKHLLIFCVILLIMMNYSEPLTAHSDDKPKNCTALSSDLLIAVRLNKSTDDIINHLASISPEDLAAELDTDALKKAFWINIYNSHIIMFLKENPDLYEKRSTFFTQKRILIAGIMLSFDDIEHGIIRRSKVKLGLGMINKLFPGEAEKLFRVKKVDPRVHFALNCGAESCPLVRNYRAETVDEQLDAAAKDYLELNTKYMADKNSVLVTPLMSWFRGDFGGKKGMIHMLKKYEIIPADIHPSITFDSYSWELDIDNFTSTAE